MFPDSNGQGVGDLVIPYILSESRTMIIIHQVDGIPGGLEVPPIDPSFLQDGTRASFFIAFSCYAIFTSAFCV
jgi:hypothetical protein